MRVLTVEEVAQACGGRLLGPVTLPTVARVCTDSRAPDVQGSLFFALRGPNHDGHAFVNDVLARGAVAAVISDAARISPAYHETGRLIYAPDTTKALGRLAGWYRRQLAAQVVAVVGSNGKTTTKDMINTLLRFRRRGRCAPASFNNAVGVPLTLLSAEPADEFVVVEIGTNHPGEIQALARIARPDMAVVTSIGEEHLEFFGDIDAVASEEFSIVAGLERGALLAISEQAAPFMPHKLRPHEPAAAPRRARPGSTPPPAERLPTTLVYGLDAGADLRATDLRVEGRGQHFRVNGRFEYFLPAPGRHSVLNALGAIAVAMRFRMEHEEIAAAMLHVRLPPMRIQRSRIGPLTLINDAYNANPASMRAAFDLMDHLPDAGRKVFILGDMRELGPQAVRCHQEVGRDAGRSTAAVILTVGAYAAVMRDGAVATAGPSKRIADFATIDALVEKLADFVEAGDTVLLKASRAFRLEQIVEPLTHLAQQLEQKRTSVAKS